LRSAGIGRVPLGREISHATSSTAEKIGQGLTGDFWGSKSSKSCRVAI